MWKNCKEFIYENYKQLINISFLFDPSHYQEKTIWKIIIKTIGKIVEIFKTD